MVLLLATLFISLFYSIFCCANGCGDGSGSDGNLLLFVSFLPSHHLVHYPPAHHLAPFLQVPKRIFTFFIQECATPKNHTQKLNYLHFYTCSIINIIHIFP